MLKPVSAVATAPPISSGKRPGAEKNDGERLGVVLLQFEQLHGHHAGYIHQSDIAGSVGHHRRQPHDGQHSRGHPEGIVQPIGLHQRVHREILQQQIEQADESGPAQRTPIAHQVQAFHHVSQAWPPSGSHGSPSGRAACGERSTPACRRRRAAGPPQPAPGWSDLAGIRFTKLAVIRKAASIQKPSINRSTAAEANATERLQVVPVGQQVAADQFADAQGQHLIGEQSDVDRPARCATAAARHRLQQGVPAPAVDHVDREIAIAPPVSTHPNRASGWPASARRMDSRAAPRPGTRPKGNSPWLGGPRMETCGAEKQQSFGPVVCGAH